MPWRRGLPGFFQQNIVAVQFGTQRRKLSGQSRVKIVQPSFLALPHWSSIRECHGAVQVDADQLFPQCAVEAPKEGLAERLDFERDVHR
jgi:hypothetical protein